jgi:hypothetical protein
MKVYAMKKKWCRKNGLRGGMIADAAIKTLAGAYWCRKNGLRGGMIADAAIKMSTRGVLVPEKNGLRGGMIADAAIQMPTWAYC